jgi:hypothetical protein
MRSPVALLPILLGCIGDSKSAIDTDEPPSSP